MDLLLSIYNYVVANAATLLAIAFAIEVAAVQIVNLTPTDVDNKIVAGIRKVLVFIANIVPNAKTS